MAERYIYPQLDPGAARRVLASQAGRPLSDLEDDGNTAHPDAAPAATGGHPVGTDKLLEIQAQIRQVAKIAGYPVPLSRGATQNFDRPCGTVLYQSMEIVPADAAEEGVWSFLSLVVAPEIGPWRFPGRADERLLGRPRNVLRRVWWRAWAFGEDLDFAPPGCTPLGEDEFVQVMERPSLGGNRRTARAIRDALWRAEGQGLAVARSELMREITRRLRAERSHRALEILDDVQFAQLLDGLVDVSIEHLIATPHPA